MFSLIKQVFIVLLSFSKSLERDRTECLYLNGKPCMISSTLIDLDPVELKYYPFMISLDKFSGSCNVLSPKTCVPKETKDINVKVFNINKNEAKIMARHISCDCKRKFDSAACNSYQKWSNETCQCECKNYHKCKKDYSWTPSTCICEKSKYSKSIADTSVVECDEIISVMDILSTKMRNTIATNVPINSDDEKVRYCYILHTVLLVIKLLLIITIVCYHYKK